MNKEEIYSTKDLALATYLKIKGIKLSTGYVTETKSWTFCDPMICEELSLELRNGESQVEVLRYESTRRSLLGMTHDKRS